ncbi:MAG: sigma-70 family RNA polymerase sigma factor, partial [Planctomycetes bacterium]|nr:sigma-70 family RNA polymerase sigma factor [Planctomycetota bacterium]
RTVRIPNYVAQGLRKIRKVGQEFILENGEGPGATDLQEELGIDAGHLDRLMKGAKSTVSLDQSLSDGDLRLGEVLVDLRTTSPHRQVEETSRDELLRQVLGTLTRRERLVLELRYGLTESQSYTLEEVSQVLGISRERVRQIEGNAIKRLQSPIRANRLRGLLD